MFTESSHTGVSWKKESSSEENLWNNYPRRLRNGLGNFSDERKNLVVT